MVDILKLMLNQDFEIVICSRFVNGELLSCDMNSTVGSVVPLAMFEQTISSYRKNARLIPCLVCWILDLQMKKHLTETPNFML